MLHTTFRPSTIRLLSLPLLLAACGTTPGPTVNKPSSVQLGALALPTNGQTYTLRNECSGKVVDVAALEPANGGAIDQWTYNGGNNQLWTLQATDSGYYKLVAKHSNKLLFVSGSGTANSSYLEQWEDFNGNAQQWKFTDVGNGYYKLSPRHAPDKVLDVPNSSLNDGTRLVIYTDNGGCSQHWKLEPIGLQYSPRITIKNASDTTGAPATRTENGVRYFTGNWESFDKANPAIMISTSEPIVIENSNLRGNTTLIRWTAYFTNVTVHDTNFYGVNPDEDGKDKGHAIKLQEPVNFVFEHNYIEGLSGILVNNYRGTDTSRFAVRYNKAKNLDGRVSNGTRAAGAAGYRSDPKPKTGEYPAGGFVVANFLQLSNTTSKSNVEVSWNRIENEPGNSAVEDNINIYSSSGTATSPISIHDNLIKGAYSSTLNSTYNYSGGGILLGDGCNSAYQTAVANTVLETSNYGIAIANGNHQSIHHNTIYGTGKLPNGAAAEAGPDAGIYLRNYCTSASGNPDGIGISGADHDPNTVEAYSNKIGFGAPTTANPNRRSDISIGPVRFGSGTAPLQPAGKEYSNTTGDAGTGAVSQTTVNNAVLYWEQHAANNGVVPGPR